MKRFLAVCLAGMLVLSGCTASSNQEALEVRQSLLEAAGCSFQADITADYGEQLYTFTLDCSFSPEEVSLEVLEPASIAGIRARVSQEGAVLQYEDRELDFGKLANGFVSPVSVPWLLLECWQGAYISCSGADEDLNRVTYLKGYEEAQLSVDTWFREGIPVRAEVVYGGVRCLTIEIREFQLL